MKPRTNTKKHEKFKTRFAAIRVISSVLILVFIDAVLVAAQTSNPTPDLETILKNAAQQTKNYREAFKNLLADETKTFQIFDNKGRPKKPMVIESNFMIFSSLKDEKVSSEYRDIIRIDGKALKDGRQRSADLFEELARAKSVRQELEQIQRESSRYDTHLEIGGLTLFEAPMLDERLRPYFEFKLAREAGVFVLEYRQTKLSPYILIGTKAVPDGQPSMKYDLDLPKKANSSSVFMRGKLWIDASTFRIRGEKRELIANLQNVAEPQVFFSEEYEYQPSDFEILVPKKIVYTYFKVRFDDESREVSVLPEIKVTFEYRNFRKSRVDIKIEDEDEN